MKKKYWIYIILFILLIAGGLCYYFYSPVQTTTSTVQEKSELKETGSGLENKENEQLKKVDTENREEGNEGVTNDKNKGIKNSDGGNKIIETRGDKKGEGYDIGREIAVAGITRTDFRNPFEDFRRDNNKSSAGIQVSALVNHDKINSVDREEEKLTREKLKANLPFELTGIIGSDDKRLAVIQDRNGSRIMHNGDYIEEFRILNIRKENIILAFRGVIFEIGLGSDTGES